MRWLDSITDSMEMNLIKLQELVKCRSLVGCHLWGRTELEKTEVTYHGRVL